jgi:hypothetical protein
MSRELNLTVTRGCTLKSPEIFSVNEAVPSNITYEQLMQGIEDGIYTLKSLEDKLHIGQVRERPNAEVKANLIFQTAGDILTFTIPADITVTWPNQGHTLFYDVFETDAVTGEVLRIIYGKILVIAALTIET